MGGCDLGDQRLNKRAALLLERFSHDPELSIPAACKGLAETTAAYRFFDNESVCPDKMLQPHVEATLERVRGCRRVLLVQDTTELDFTGRSAGGELGALSWPERVGLLDHSMVAFSPEGLCLGVVQARIWTREGPPGKRQHKRKPIEKKESIRWVDSYTEACRIARQAPDTLLVTVADREGDIYEFFVQAQQAAAEGKRAEWIVRACQDRRLSRPRPAGDKGYNKLWATVRAAPVLGTRTCTVPRKQEQPARQAALQVRTASVWLKAPFRRGEELPSVQVQAVMATEEDAPQDGKALEWLLLTSLPASSLEDACRIIDHYIVRWQVETYFRVLKGACRVEDLQLRTVARLKRCIVVKKIAAWRTLFVAHLSRRQPEATCTVAFEDAEWKSVHMVSQDGPLPAQAPSLARFVAMVAALAGYLGRRGDGPPGPIRLCKGLEIMHHYATAWRAFGPERR